MKTQADLYEMAAKVMRMCEGVGIDWRECIKGNGSIGHYQWVSQGLPAGLVPCLAIVEGKPVFADDELFWKDGTGKILAKRVAISFDNCTWIKPKPKTVMVELLREDAEEFCGSSSKWKEFMRLQDACKKALES